MTKKPKRIPKWADDKRAAVIDEMYPTDAPLTAIFDHMKLVSPKLPMPTPQALASYANARGLRRPLELAIAAGLSFHAEIELEQKARAAKDPRYAEGYRYCIGPLCAGTKKFLSTHAGNRMCDPCRSSARNAAP